MAESFNSRRHAISLLVRIGKMRTSKYGTMFMTRDDVSDTKTYGLAITYLQKHGVRFNTDLNGYNTNVNTLGDIVSRPIS